MAMKKFWMANSRSKPISDASAPTPDNKDNGEPVSRFWACFFSNSIFALFWTFKMKKTLKWLGISVSTWIAGMLLILFAFMMVDDGYPDAATVLIWVGICIPFVPLIYFMYRWTTQYNLKHFGYRSQDLWKEAERERHSDTGKGDSP